MKVKNPYEPAIKLVHPKFFHQQCDKCKLELKDVDMWKYTHSVEYTNNIGISCRYVCCNCIKDKESATKYLMNKDDYIDYTEARAKLEKLMKKRK